MELSAGNLERKSVMDFVSFIAILSHGPPGPPTPVYIYLDQCSYLEKVIERFGMTNAKYARTPLPVGYIPMPNKGEVNPQMRTQFQQIIGSLLYIMLGTRPDLQSQSLHSLQLILLRNTLTK